LALLVEVIDDGMDGTVEMEIAKGLVSEEMPLQVAPGMFDISSGAYFGSHSTLSQGLASGAAREALLVWLLRGDRSERGTDASTMEANAALRTIVRRDSGETYREMLKRMAEESGIETPRPRAPVPAER
jgi:hypothetical protein